MNDNSELVPLTIDLTIGEGINESWLAMFGGAVETMLGAMFGGSSIPVNVVGTRSQISSFEKTLGSEAKYLKALNKHGLNDPKITKSKASLDRAIKGFERETGIVWPFK
jgi:hypothetical protein